MTTFDTDLRAIARAEAVAPAPGVGAVLGRRFALHEVIARGGMATVYRGRDLALDQSIAIKLPRVERGARVSALLERELLILGRLAHPGIVALRQPGRHAGLPFGALELLDGETLADRLGRGPLPAAEAIAMLDDVLAALAHAHGHGVVHRDITPRNVFACRDGRFVLLDFGVAIDRGRRAGTLTRGAGTPGYMPPEHAGDTDPRGDLWAAAVVFSEAISGTRPECERDVRIPASVPGRIARVVRRALSCDRERRPPTAMAMRAVVR